MIYMTIVCSTYYVPIVNSVNRSYLRYIKILKKIHFIFHLFSANDILTAIHDFKSKY